MKFDKVNNKIIVELLNNCRISNVELGKKVGLSREGAANRIGALEDSGIITGYGIDIDLNRLGFTLYQVLIKLKDIEVVHEKQFIESWAKNDNVIFVEKALGKYDVLCMFALRSLKELDSEIENLKSMLGAHLKQLDIDIWVANYDTMSSFFTDKPLSIVSKTWDGPPYQLDDIDRRLLAELALNANESSVNLAKKLGVSAITVANRIKALVDNDIIKDFRAQIDFAKLGVSRYVLYLNASGPNIERRLAEFCKHYRLVADFTKFVGRYNYSIEIFAESNSSFKKAVDDITSQFADSISEYDTLMLFEEIKHKPLMISKEVQN